jgi:hypothetical protein
LGGSSLRGRCYWNLTRPAPAAMARLIATELDRNEIWD